jgi:hypothetical protein
MLASKLLFGFGLYLLYKFSLYFYTFIENGFPRWDDDLVIGNSTINLFFAPYGAIVAIIFSLILLYVSGKDLFIYYFSNSETMASIIRFEPSTEDTSDNAPINIVISLNGREVVLDFMHAALQKKLKEGDLIPVKYIENKPNFAVLNEKELDKILKD